MSQNENLVIRHINNPELNRLTAPENRLFRPTINWRRLAGATVTFLLVCFLVSLCGVFAYYAVDGVVVSRSEAVSASFWAFPFVGALGSIVFLKDILILGVLLYQHYASSSIRLRCCFEPSCSQYTILALKKYGVVVGCIKSVSRMRRCGHQRGMDYP
jgi:putative component of membrane protein insertase Oxa1/YidC/SpoIIIJ protein YidD